MPTPYPPERGSFNNSVPLMARDSYNWRSATVIIPDFAGDCKGDDRRRLRSR
jgi:hypothetical protein